MSAPIVATASRTIVVVGKESVGKSALIASITTRPTYTSNFRGSTVGCDVYRFRDYEFVDTPGILRKTDTETTRSAIQKLQETETVMLVAQATHLDEDLDDLLPLVQSKRCVIVVTFWDKVSGKRRNTDTALLNIGNELKLPVLPVDARRLTDAERSKILSAVDRATVSQVHRAANRTGWQVTAAKSIFDHKLAGPILSALLLFMPSLAAVWCANALAAVTDPLVGNLLAPLIAIFRGWPSLPREILVGNYGLLTMGPLLFVWAIPTVLFYSVILGAYKASGLLDRISTSLHRFVRHVGLSGRDLVRIVMGFGCNVPAVISTRACSSCSRSTAISAIAFGSACSYQFGATLAVFAAAGKPWLVLPFMTYLTLTTIIYAHLTSSREARSKLNFLILDGRTFMTWPPISAVWREASQTIRSFFRTAIPIFLVITIVASFLAWTNVLSYLAKFLNPTMSLLRLPPEAALPAIMACIRKDGILLFAKYDRLAGLTNVQLLTAVYFAGEFLPCLVTVITIAREKSRRFVASLLIRQATAAIVFSLLLAWAGKAIGSLF